MITENQENSTAVLSQHKSTVVDHKIKWSPQSPYIVIPEVLMRSQNQWSPTIFSVRQLISNDVGR